MATRTLVADCITDVPIAVPGGWTFDGGGHTIRVVDPPGGMFRGGVIERRQGMGIGGVTNVTIDGSGLTPGCSPDSEVVGILFAKEGGTISEVTIVALRRGTGEPCGVGIAIIGAAFYGVDIRGATITNAGSSGVVATDGAAVQVVDTQISGGLRGIVFSDPDTRGNIVETLVTDPVEQGIVVADHADIRVDGSVVTDARRVCIHASDGATLDATDNNQLRGNYFGIVVEGEDTRATIEETTIEQAGQDGIVVQDAADANLSSNTISAASRFGIGVLSGATAEITDNTVMESGSIGILAAFGASADVMDNKLTGPHATASPENWPFGIAFSEAATGSIVDNVVTGHSNQDPTGLACGIRIDAGVGEVEVRDNQFPPPGNEVDLCDERQ
jgi:hypothetical protein